MTMKALQQRWKTVDGLALAEEALLFLQGMRNDLPADIGYHAGRRDLRGLVLPSPKVGASVLAGGNTATILSDLNQFHSVHWKELDLSFAQLPSLRFFGSLISDCVFIGVNGRDWRLWHSEVKDSSFIRADLRDAALGTWHEGRGNVWQNITFDGADLRGVLASGCLILHSSFKETKLKGTEFLQATIQHCQFSGLLQDVLFDGRPIPGSAEPGVFLDTDFSDAIFRDVEFRGCHFEDVKLPPGIEVFPNFPRLARRVLELLENDETVEARMLKGEFNLALKLPGDDSSVEVFNRADYLNSGGDPLAKLADSVIRQAAEEQQGLPN